MSGVEYLLDTNFILGIVKGNPNVISVLRDLNADINTFGYSSISRMEVLGFAGITPHEEDNISKLLADIVYLPITGAIEDETIGLRRSLRIKLPDALILATAQVHHLKLLTLDKELNGMKSKLNFI